MLKRLQKLDLDKIIRYGIAAIMLAVPLYQKFPFISIPGTYVSVRIEDFLVFVVFLAWIIKNLSNWKSLLKDKIINSLVVFLGIALLSLVSGILLTHTVVAHIGILHWGRRIEYLIGAIIGATSLKSKEDVIFYVKCMAVVVVIAFLFGVGQVYLKFPVITTQNEEYSKGIALRYIPGGHLASTFAGHYDLASYLILVTPVFMALAFSSRATLESLVEKASAKKIKLILLLVVALGLWLLAHTLSRISAISFVMAVSIALILIRKHKAMFIFAVITTLIVALSSNFVGRYTSIFDVLLKKFTGAITVSVAYAADSVTASTPLPVMPMIQDISTSIRTNVEWPRAIRALEKNPLLGTGFSSIDLATDNDYLRMLGEVGILGFLAASLFMVNILKTLLKAIPMPKEIDFKSAYLAGLIGAIAGVLLNAVFIDVFEASKFAIIFWFMVGFGLYLAKNEKTKKLA